MTPDEFEAVCKAYSDRGDAEFKESWERTRMLATITIQPHVSKKITPRKLLPFPWDKETPQGDSSKETPKLTAEEKKERFEKLVDRLGDKTI